MSTTVAEGAVALAAILVLSGFANASALDARHARARVRRVVEVRKVGGGLSVRRLRQLSFALTPGDPDAGSHDRARCKPGNGGGRGGPKHHGRKHKKDKKRHPHKARRHKKPKHQGHKDRRRRRDGRPLALPVPRRCLSVPEIGSDHHDYPAWDVELPRGTVVRALRPGKIIDRTRRGPCGKGLIVRGADNYTYTYCHGTKLLRGKRRHVAAGEPIMRSGNTGHSTGPHLHLQIRGPRGRLVCPQRLVRAAFNEREIPTWQTRPRGCIDR